METTEDGVELHTPPTRLPPPLRDTSVSGETFAQFLLSSFSDMKNLSN